VIIIVHNSVFFDHADRLCRNRIVLKEHFRCMPEIINFCNQHFYEPANIGLYPLKQYDENRLTPLQTIFCQDGFNEGEGQNRVNKNEAIAIANKIKEVCSDTRYNGKTIGVITLQGNKQANIIEQEILQQIGEQEYHNRKIICGNAAHFQGDERDIIFLSLVTAHNHNRRAVTGSADERRYNVAVSRAKEQIWLVHSIQLSDLSNTNDLRYKLMSYFLNPTKVQEPINEVITRSKGNQPQPFDSWFEVDVYNDIVRKGHKLYPQYKVGAFKIDLVILLQNGIKLAIECDGDKFHGAEQFEKDMMRQKVLERCGWTFFRVRGAEYYSDRQKALEQLWKMIENLSKEEIVITKPSIEEKQILKTVIEVPIKIEIPNEEKVEKEHKTEEETTKIAQIDVKPVEILSSAKISTSAFTAKEILVFSNRHLVYKFRNESKEIKSIDDIMAKIELENPADEQIIYVTGTDNFSGYMIFGFENGKMIKVKMSAYQTSQNREKLKNAYYNGSKLLFIQKLNEGINIELAWLSTPDPKTKKMKLMIFETQYLGDAVDTKNGQGVEIIKLRAGCKVEALKLSSSLTSINDKNYYKGEKGEGTRGRTGCFIIEGDIF
jgi:very-short-patch-repair endonuclease